ncbi:18668_t:CDS:2, partial [Gigaspora rosea]
LDREEEEDEERSEARSTNQNNKMEDSRKVSILISAVRWFLTKTVWKSREGNKYKPNAVIKSTHLPVSRSQMTMASSTLPYSSNLLLRESSSVPHDKPPTNNLTDIARENDFFFFLEQV